MERAMKVGSRLSRYPELIAHCKSEAISYASCVSAQENVKLNSCSDEFDKFKSCLLKAAKTLKTRLFSRSVALGLLIRLAVIVYGEWHDRNLHVPFTDVDYKVFTDAARYVSRGESPYKRHTYRYPPLLAWLLVPNLLFPCWGKILFSTVDVFTGLLIRKLCQCQNFSEWATLRCAQAWIFNPLSIIISTRGNSDSIISFVVLSSVLFLLKRRPALAGLFLALSIHIRLYPIVFSLPMYLSLKPDEDDRGVAVFQKITSFSKRLYPNRLQVLLTLSCVLLLLLLTGFCYLLYEMDYLRESVLYHLTRRDTRHNFSVFFYLLYLEPSQPSFLIFLPQLLVLLALSLSYGRSSTLLFCVFAQTFVLVSYNPVLTAQYFVWHLSLLTPSLPRFGLSLLEAGKLGVFWVFGQVAWLVPAYLLEFRGRNTFLYIWLQGMGFFCANVAVLVRLMKRYRVPVGATTVKSD